MRKRFREEKQTYDVVAVTGEQVILVCYDCNHDTVVHEGAEDGSVYLSEEHRA